MLVPLLSACLEAAILVFGTQEHCKTHPIIAGSRAANASIITRTREGWKGVRGQSAELLNSIAGKSSKSRTNTRMRLARVTLIWAALAAAICVPIAAAAASPLLEWRDAIYIVAGFAGIIALGLLLVQPLLIGGYLPGPSAYRARRAHHWIGGALVVAVVIHVAGLWFTSPPDMIDALLFTSPTPFSPFGVIAMWAVFAVALLAALRRRLRLRTFRIVHMSLAVIIVVASVIHGMLVEGTMETMSKAALCALILAAAIKVIADLWIRQKRATSGRESVARR